MRPLLPAQARGEIEWVDLESGTRQSMFFGACHKTLGGDVCDGVRLALAHAEPGEKPEGYLPNHVLLVILAGETSCRVRWSAGPKRAGKAGPNSVHLFPAEMPYSSSWDAPVDYLVVEIAPEFVSAVAGAEAGRGRVELRASACEDDPFLVHAALALADEVRTGSPGGRLCGENLAVALAARLLHTHAEVRPRAQQRPLSRAQLDLVLGHIAGHLETDLSLRELAGVAEMDVFRFVRSFKQSTGLPPHRYVLHARVERAKFLLRDSALSISDVALRTGFATPSHFATTFRRVTKATPRAFRDSLP